MKPPPVRLNMIDNRAKLARAIAGWIGEAMTMPAEAGAAALRSKLAMVKRENASLAHPTASLPDHLRGIRAEHMQAWIQDLDVAIKKLSGGKP
jgi:hypothetical protein